MTRNTKAIIVFVLFATSVAAEAKLEIEKAYCGAEGSWCDATAFLQKKVRGDSLSVNITQPFQEFRGDPAPNQVKNLIIDYKLNGVSYELALHEEFPVAFAVDLPSPDAVIGHTPRIEAMMKDAKSHLRGGFSWRPYLVPGVMLILFAWAMAATTQVWRLKKQLSVRA
jgi:hypothetical protein